ncbi:MAG: AAA family ATPase [Cyanobacteriota bacterium]|nr:AAA family ATPase [Cyanobacteriota bacterium]
MTILPGYHLNQKLYQGTRTLVYHGTRTVDNQPVVIKFLRNEYPTFNELVQFRNQYTIAKNLNLPGIVQPLALETYGNGYALVMLDEGYISLGEWYNGKVAIADALVIAIQLSDILHGLYQNRVIHKDIKPANILIHPETKQVKLIDFSISSLLPKETQEIQNPNVLEGTLAYLSPEQTGRMNRGIDYRSDFYSLGVTLYELFAGQLPFNSSDPIELVHAHMAKIPMGMGNGERDTGTGQEIPSVIGEIVLKLMAKNAEDRYQSALGLKYDLTRCLDEWKETGRIESFELAQRDICDRFAIPEKLYGREAEVARLLAAFERVAAGNREMVLVAGFSGIGKTAVVNEVHKPITRDRGYFIKGKFDQFNRSIPFSAFVQAFRDLMGQLLGESDADLAKWKRQILEAVGENGQVLIDAIPSLEQIIGSQPPAPELSGNAAQNRFNLLFDRFVGVFATQDHPLVMFLDDLQWADSASLNLLALLMEELEAGYLLVLGAYRDNEVFAAHPLKLTLDELGKREASVNTLTLAPLGCTDITHLVASTLLCAPEVAAPLSELVYQKTQGNPFFTTQFLQGLYEDGCITFATDAGYWQCNLAQVRQLALTDDVVAFMVGRLRKLPEVTQGTLKLAACIGNRFDLGTLALVCDRPQDEAAVDLWQALQEGFVIPESETYKFFQGNEDFKNGTDDVVVSYRFLHDRVQQAAYSLIPEDRKQLTHLKIGRRLLQNTSEGDREEKIFSIVNQLNYGIQYLSQPDELEELARLNWIAGCKAKSATAHQAALDYATSGIGLLSRQCWHQQYELTLALYDLAAETAYLNGSFSQMQTWVEQIIHCAKTPLDTSNAYTTQILACIARQQISEAIRIGLEILFELGIDCPVSPTPAQIERAAEEVETLIPETGIAQLSHLPVMTDRSSLAALKILNVLMPPAYITNPQLYLLLSLSEVKLSITQGNASLSAYVYVNYGIISFIYGKNVEFVYQCGQLALNILEQFSDKEAHSKALATVAGFSYHWKSHLHKCAELGYSGYHFGLDVGDFDSMSWSAFFGHQCLFFSGFELNKIVEKLNDIGQSLSKYEQRFHLNYTERLRQFGLNLMGHSVHPTLLVGEAYNEERSPLQYRENNDLMSLAYLYLYKIILCYLFNEHSQALDHTTVGRDFLGGVPSQLAIPLFYFYESLVQLSTCDDQTETEISSALDRVQLNQEKMKSWANSAPMNFQHKYDLVEAEKCRVLGQKIEAIEQYDRAIAGAKENEYLQEEALANELAAKFYLDWGKEKVASAYMLEAYYCYAKWGAKAKTEHLEKTYAQLLAPIFEQPQKSELYLSSTTASSHPTVRSSSTTTSSALDLRAAIKASQTLSGEIEFEALLCKLMTIVLESAGADTGALILSNAQIWEIVAHCRGGECHLASIPVEEADFLPVSIVRIVERTQKAIVFNPEENDTSFAGDRYLMQQPPKSLLCVPLLNQGRPIGILYLENNLCAGAFTEDRVEVLNLLCSQAAISLENARLYQNARAANKMLQKSLLDLKQAQLQLVQSEKMSALGNLVAGVAHEINNPVGFIGGNLQPARDYVQDLLGLIDLYQEENPDPGEAIEDEIEAIDLDFIREDLPKLLDSMKLGVERIAHISTSLRTFSRADTEYKVSFNVHDGLESTVLILKHRLKANEHRPAIEIVKDYGNIEPIQCFPGQLNQVFTNLIANAIDALEEGNSGRSFEEIAANPDRITIKTEMTPETLLIEIADNGIGMPEEVVRRIFEQGFTTKEVGKGTGLGMAIAREIVENKHSGTISCTSEHRRGTQFAIVLPVGNNSERAREGSITDS